MIKEKKIYYYGIIGILFLLSFYFYSSLFYPALNSDNAISILMIHYFKLPHDIYFWGQDRMGSLIPLLGQIFFKYFNFSALVSEAITHYLILLLGFLAFASFLKSNFYKLIFALIWFFPPMRLIDLTQFSFGIHYSLLAIAIYFISKAYKAKRISLKFHIYLISSYIILLTAVWVSDMAIISVFLVLFIQLIFHFKENGIKISDVFRSEIFYTITAILLGFLLIHYAKSCSPNQQNYALLSNLQETKQAISVFLKSVIEILLFRANEPFTSLYSYFVIFDLGLVVYLLKTNKFEQSKLKWIIFFLFDALLMFIVIICSKWTIINGVPRRYFVCTYISFAFAFLMIIDNLQLNAFHSRFLKGVLLLTVLIGGYGTIYNLKYVWPKTLTPKVTIVNEFEKLGKIGIIADYWNSYIISCVNPNTIKATPHDKSWAVRNYEMVDDVFKQKNIYVIKDMWLDNFPDTLIQFGHVLVKDGIEFNLGNCCLTKYKKIK